MNKLGYIQSLYNPSLYYNPTAHVKTMKHGDEFIAVGSRIEIGNFKEQVAARLALGGRAVAFTEPAVPWRGPIAMAAVAVPCGARPMGSGSVSAKPGAGGHLCAQVSFDHSCD